MFIDFPYSYVNVYQAGYVRWLARTIFPGVQRVNQSPPPRHHGAAALAIDVERCLFYSHVVAGKFTSYRDLVLLKPPFLDKGPTKKTPFLRYFSY